MRRYRLSDLGGWICWAPGAEKAAWTLSELMLSLELRIRGTAMAFAGREVLITCNLWANQFPNETFNMKRVKATAQPRVSVQCLSPNSLKHRPQSASAVEATLKYHAGKCSSRIIDLWTHRYRREVGEVNRQWELSTHLQWARGSVNPYEIRSHWRA